MWNCMVIAFQAGVGSILWGLLFMVIVIAIGLIVNGISKLWSVKPKYKGKPIVIKGGKKDE